ncbi:imidazolonepropionase [Paragonimus westermani]|uniref:Probable imidazolonepropionase n=1 Tax=Paragonimus westermani TaxID=34504 RepID=A0A5J4NZ23_9TREM|nr:imidazolonepropionase [Paragonimus westermani]
MRTVVRNVKTIVNVLRRGPTKLRFDESDKIEITTSGSGSRLALLVDDGVITDFGEEECILRKQVRADCVVDCNGGCVIPGFVDAHTHPVWAGDRLHEFTLKGMVRKGTTTMECKTGYGLRWEVEEKLLKVLNKAKRELPIDISITFLSAHSVPRFSNAEEFSKHIATEQIPKLKNLMDGGLSVDNIDVFCEKGVFELEQSSRILTAGKSIGLNLNFHADELSALGGAELAGKLGARAASHLEEASPAGVAAMAASGTAAVLLPTTAQLLRLRPPPARAIIQAGVPVALGTDFNPNAYCLSMPIVMYLACTTMGMSPDETLAASTINAAYSLAMSDRVGAITVGRQADLVVLNCDRWENIIYRLGEAESLITHVIKKGQVIFSQEGGFFGF